MEKTPKLILIGLGKVGQAVFHEIDRLDLKLQIVGLADSSACLLGEPLSEELLEKAIQMKAKGGRLSDMQDAFGHAKLSQFFSHNTIIVDTSAASGLDWNTAITNGCKLVFANKNAHSAPWKQASKLYQQPGIRYESTVGAGLPIINTLRCMVESGDQITRIEGVMSGTLGYLCSQLEKWVSYSQAIRQAFEAGYTEPDPRDDLSGYDVLRKAIILARTAGWQLEQDDFQVEPLYDEKRLGNSVEDFLQNTSLLDQTYALKVESAAKRGKVLRYLATISPTGGSVGLQEVDRDSQLGALQGTGNYFAVYSQNYNEIPLVIAGPGAGIAVTANGVLSDIIALLNR